MHKDKDDTKGDDKDDDDKKPDDKDDRKRNGGFFFSKRPSAEELKRDNDRSTAWFCAFKVLNPGFKKRWGASKGASIAWGLLFLAKPEDHRHERSMEDVRKYSPDELAYFRRIVAERTPRTKNMVSREILRRVSVELDKVRAPSPFDPETGEIGEVLQ
jgi:hypothetical protein